MILCAWCAVLFLYGIAAGPLYRTESLRAIIGRECLNGQWLFPVLYGEPFLTKPPGQYVAIGLCSLPLGEVTAASARLPSVLAASAALFLVYRLFRSALDERAALLAALLLPTNLLWLDKVPSAEIDMTLLGWVAAAIVFLQRALDTNATRWWLLSLLSLALGTLTKWTAPAFYYLTAIPLLAWRGELRVLFGWRHLTACACAVVVCALWAGAVAQQVGGENLAETIRKEAAYRFAPKAAAKGYNYSELGTYPFLVLAAHLPIAIFAYFTFRPRFWELWDDRGKKLLQLLHCWVWPNLLFWSVVPNHNVRYILPLTPGLMGLGAMGLMGLWKGRGRAPRSFLVSFLILWLAVRIVFVELVIPVRGANRNPEPAAAELRRIVPPDRPLYLFRLKDEGVMFHYARRAVRLSDPRTLPPGAFAVLIRQEWEDRASFGRLELLHWMHDQQGDPLILVQCPDR